MHIIFHCGVAPHGHACQSFHITGLKAPSRGLYWLALGFRKTTWAPLAHWSCFHQPLLFQPFVPYSKKHSILFCLFPFSFLSFLQWVQSAFTSASNDSAVVAGVYRRQLWLAVMKTDTFGGHAHFFPVLRFDALTRFQLKGWRLVNAFPSVSGQSVLSDKERLASMSV